MRRVRGARRGRNFHMNVKEELRSRCCVVSSYGGSLFSMEHVAFPDKGWLIISVDKLLDDEAGSCGFLKFSQQPFGGNRGSRALFVRGFDGAEGAVAYLLDGLKNGLVFGYAELGEGDEVSSFFFAIVDYRDRYGGEY